MNKSLLDTIHINTSFPFLCIWAARSAFVALDPMTETSWKENDLGRSQSKEGEEKRYKIRTILENAFGDRIPHTPCHDTTTVGGRVHFPFNKLRNETNVQTNAMDEVPSAAYSYTDLATV